MLRLIGVACAASLGLIGAMFLVDSRGASPWWMWLLGPVGLIVPIVICCWLLRQWEHRSWHNSAGVRVATLKEQGLLVPQTFEAARYCEIEEFEDEGPTLLIELRDARVLCLSGQYLDEYATGSPVFQIERRFPCSRFTLLRHAKEEYVAEIVSEGELLSCDGVGPPFTMEDHERGTAFYDGQIITDILYEELLIRLRVVPRLESA